MKSLRMSLILVALIQLAGMPSWGQLRQGGIHDGGGTGALDRNDPNAPPRLADHFLPTESAVRFEPDSPPIDLEENFPGLREEIRFAISMLGTYGHLESTVLEERRPGQLERVIYDPNGRYHFVSQLPDVPECRVPRDNSGVPDNYEMYKLACTRGNVTLLLDQPRRGVKSMALSGVRDLILHEGLRRWPRRLATSSIEIIVSGVSLLVETYKAQLAGDKSSLTRASLERIRQLMEELRVNEFGVRGGVDLSVPLAPNTPDDNIRLYRLDQWTLLTSHGGLMRVGWSEDVPVGCDGDANESCVSENAFIGIGSVIASKARIGSGVSVLNSYVRGARMDMRPASIMSGASLLRSRIEVDVVGEKAELIDSVVLMSGRYPDHIRSIGSRVILQNSVISGGLVQIGDRVEARNTRMSFQSFHRSRILMGADARFFNSTVRSAMRPASTESTFDISFGEGASMQNSVVETSNRFEQGDRSQLINVRLRARPFEVDSVDRTSGPLLVQIAPQITLANTDTPVIFLAGSNWWNRGNPSIEFVSSLDLNGAAICRMGINAESRVEAGLKGHRIVVRGASDLQNCATTVPIPGPPRFSRLGGWFGGYFLSQEFIN